MSDKELEVLYNFIKPYTDTIVKRDIMNKLLRKIKLNGYDVYTLPEHKLKEYFENVSK